jgi:hypothetical protein
MRVVLLLAVVLALAQAGEKRKTHGRRKNGPSLLLLTVCVDPLFSIGAALKHHLVLKQEHRRFFVISTFGLLEEGSITVAIKGVRLLHQTLLSSLLSS